MRVRRGLRLRPMSGLLVLLSKRRSVRVPVAQDA
jgi:hypothetical protein